MGAFMKNRLLRFFLRRYESERTIVRKRAESLLFVLAVMTAAPIILVALIDVPLLRISLSVMAVVSFGLGMMVAAGNARLANRIATPFLAAILVGMVFLQPYREGAELYSVAAYEAMMILVAGLIAMDARQLLEIIAVGAIGISLDFFTRVVPGGGLADNLNNYIITLGLLAVSGLSGYAIMNRNRQLLELAENEAAKNREQVRRLEAAILSSRDVLGMGVAVKDSSARTQASLTELQGVLQAAKADMDRLSEKTRLINSSNDGIFVASKLVKDKVADQTAIVSQSSHAITEMTASVESISAITAARRASMDALKETTANGRAEMLRAAEAVNEMKSQAASIIDVVKVIRKVASQTNLLAMNAAIEAAHAGAAGAGFSVVADEIRSLSEETGRQVKLIDASIRGTIRSMETAAAITNGAQGIFGSMSEEADAVAKAMVEIGDGLKGISEGSGEMLAGVNESVNITGDVREAAGVVDDRIQLAAQSLEELRTITGEVRSSIALVAARFNDMLGDARSLSEAGIANEAGLRQLADILRNLGGS
jgi:methyl-accepting chemotaxis protein